jgi:hypothetical protein
MKHDCGLITYDDRPEVTATNASMLSDWLSRSGTVRLPPGDLYIGGDGVQVGGTRSFTLIGAGCQYHGRKRARPEHAASCLIPVHDDMPAVLQVGGAHIDGPRPGRSFFIRDVGFYRPKDYKQYSLDAPHGLDIQQADTFEVTRCAFRGFDCGIRLQHMAGSRITAGEISLCAFERNRTGVFANGEPVGGGRSTHGCLDIRTCNSVHDLVGLHFRKWCNGGSITNCMVHKGHDHCVLIQRSSITMTGNYLEAGGEPRGKHTLTIRDGSHVSSRGLVAKYLDIDDQSHLVAYPPHTVDQTHNHTLVARYGKTDSDSDPREMTGVGYTVITGSLLVTDGGIVWRCTDGGYGKKGTFKPVRVMP